MKTKEELFNENIGLIHKVIDSKFSNFKGTIYHDDMISEGYVSLLKSIDRFDNSKGCKLSTFAYMCINSAITEFVYTKIYQMKKTTEYTGDKKKKTIFLGAEILYYENASNTDDEEAYLGIFKEFDKGYEYAESKIMTDLMLNKLKEIENTGSKGYKDLHRIVKFKLQGKTTKEIKEILNVSQVTVDRKYRLAIDTLKEYFNVA